MEDPSPPSPGSIASGPEPWLHVDGDGRVVAASAAAARLLGASAGELRGRPLSTFVAATDRDALAALRDAATREPARTTLRMRAADGRTPVVELLLVAPADGSPTVACLRDVSAGDLVRRLRDADAAVIDAFAAGESPTGAMARLLAALGGALGATRAGCWARAHDGEPELVARWTTEPHADDADADADGDSPLAALRPLAGRALAGETSDSDPGTIAIPLGGDDQPPAAVVLVRDDAAPLDPAAPAALADVGARVGELLAILQERHSRIESLARLALTDELTGLPNRRAWEEMLARELARAARDGQPVCVVVLDLDGFKAFNDAHGHQAGDRVLREAAHAWQRQLRLSDLLARYGGEEFAAIIPAWPLQIAVTVVERLRQATPGGLTASAGIASWDRSETGAELFGRADAALYAAKQTGRNRTVAAAEPASPAEPERARASLPHAS